MPTPRSGMGWATYNGKIYVVGGEIYDQHIFAVVRAVEAYDPATNSWSALPAMLTARHGVNVAAIGNRLYSIGGHISRRGHRRRGGELRVQRGVRVPQMRSGLSGAVAFVLLFAVSARAQNLRAVEYDSLYLTVPDVEQARDWYMTNMGGSAGEIPERVAFGQWLGDHPLPIQLVFLKSASAQATARGFIDNIGFSFRDLDAKVRELGAAGAKVVAPVTDVPGLWKRAVVEDPWGTRLELVQDPDLLGLHHVTLVVPDPEASLEWLVHALGGDRTKLKGQIDAIRYRDLSVFYLFALKGDRATSDPGHAIDHLGFGPLDLDTVVNDLTRMGVKFVSNPNPRGYPGCTFVAGERETAGPAPAIFPSSPARNPTNCRIAPCSWNRRTASG